MTTVRFVTWQPYNFVLFFSIVFGYRHWLTQIVVVEFYKRFYCAFGFWSPLQGSPRFPASATAVKCTVFLKKLPA